MTGRWIDDDAGVLRREYIIVPLIVLCRDGSPFLCRVLIDGRSSLILCSSVLGTCPGLVRYEAPGGENEDEDE